MTKKEKTCFGILDKVFPVGKEGLREVPQDCFDCDDRMPCLKKAINTEEGYKMRSDNLERIPREGIMGRIKRWSQKKELSRLEREKDKK
ncbi:hypothetical protein ACFL6W_02035 [Thermodesulfobacteriota bacterium]